MRRNVSKYHTRRPPHIFDRTLKVTLFVQRRGNLIDLCGNTTIWKRKNTYIHVSSLFFVHSCHHVSQSARTHFADTILLNLIKNGAAFKIWLRYLAVWTTVCSKEKFWAVWLDPQGLNWFEFYLLNCNIVSTVIRLQLLLLFQQYLSWHLSKEAYWIFSCLLFMLTIFLLHWNVVQC